MTQFQSQPDPSGSGSGNSGSRTDKALPPPPLPPRRSIAEQGQPSSSSGSTSAVGDDTKDPTFLPFLQTQPQLNDGGANNFATPPYTALDPLDPSPTDTSSYGTHEYAGTVVSDTPTVEEIARIKRQGDAAGDGVIRLADSSHQPPSFDQAVASSVSSSDVPVHLSQSSDGSQDRGPAVEAGATATDDGNIQVEIDVKNRSRFFSDLSALGIPRSPRTGGDVADGTDGAGEEDGEGEGDEQGQSGASSGRRKSGWNWWKPKPSHMSKGSISAGNTPRGSFSATTTTTADEADTLVDGGSTSSIGQNKYGDPVKKSSEGEKGNKGKTKEKGKGNGKGKGKVVSREVSVFKDDHVPPMSIVIFIVGSRGDVQPYLALALALIIHAGHRVRIATHPDFRQFVLSANPRLRGKEHNGVKLEGRLEFFDAGGNPKELMAYMVKNPGLLPGIESLTNGDIKRKKDMAAEYLRGFYRSTFSPDVVSGREFAADAIISNPPAFAHIHVAEALGIPLLMSFTTTAFPHPLVNVKKSNADDWATNWMGYHLADMLMWEGLGSVINTFRTEILRLEEIPDRVASSVIDNLRIPWTYCWSPELLPKPRDWKSHIDISGFYFLDGEETYTPPEDLAAFLDEGEPPVYIGFGSVVIQDPEQMIEMIFKAVENAGVRAIISAGWAGLGKGKEGSNKEIFILTKDCPHEWLFAEGRVAAVCHHGGAGTTACGLRHGRPTIIVPFFGDQKFWGDAVHGAGAGPAPIPIKTVSIELLTAALQVAVSDEAVKAAGVLGEKIRAEKGEERGVKSFGRNMPLENMRCDVDPRKIAIWHVPDLALKLSAEAAAACVAGQKLLFSDLEPYKYEVRDHRRGVISGTSGGLSNLVTTTFGGTAQLFYSPVRGTIKTFYGIPEASLGVVGDMYEGFDNIPRLMGATYRPRGKVTDWKSGFSEGGKALGWGIWDGVTTLFTDPVDGGMREGIAGVGKGFGRGLANMMVRPAAGALGIFVLPARGIKASIKASLGQQLDPHSVLRGPRETLTREAMQTLKREDQTRILEVFEALAEETSQRKKKMDRIKWFLIAGKAQREKERLERERMRLENHESKEARRVHKEAKVAKAAAEEERELEKRKKELEEAAKAMEGVRMLAEEEAMREGEEEQGDGGAADDEGSRIISSDTKKGDVGVEGKK